MVARATAADEGAFQLADLTARWLHPAVGDEAGPSPVFGWRQSHHLLQRLASSF